MYAGGEHISLASAAHILQSNQHWLISSTCGPAAATAVIPKHEYPQEHWKQSTSALMPPKTGNLSADVHRQHLLVSLSAVVPLRV